MNGQEVENQLFGTDGLLEVHSKFQTIQGEGPFAGRPATFIRLAGCNLSCHNCDTEYTSKRRVLPVDEIVDEIDAIYNRTKLIVITGGEPFRQPIGSLCNALLGKGYIVQLETNGTLYTPGPWHACSIVCSPKTPKLNPRLVKYITAFKYVLHEDDMDPNDGLPIAGLGVSSEKIYRPDADFPNFSIYVQPMDVKDPVQNEVNECAAVASCIRNGYTLSYQIHKHLGLP